MAESVYSTKKECAVCKETFEIHRVRSKLMMVKQDADFCTYYKDVNPYYYTVWVCPHCGYAAQDIEFDKLTSTAAERIAEFLNGRKVNVNFGGIRDLNQAIATYKLAIFYGEMIKLKNSKLAGLYLRLAWVYRSGEMHNEEQAALKQAIEYFEQATSRERFPIDNMSELTMNYLIGELLRRIGDNEKAVKYLSAVVGSPQAKLEKRIADMARNVWQEMKETRRKLASTKEAITQ